MVYHNAAIYIGAMLYDTNPITTRLARSDSQHSDFDFIEVSLDSYHDHETVSRFRVNPSGTRRDAISGGTGSPLNPVAIF